MCWKIADKMIESKYTGWVIVFGCRIVLGGEQRRGSLSMNHELLNTTQANHNAARSAQPSAFRLISRSLKRVLPTCARVSRSCLRRCQELTIRADAQSKLTKDAKGRKANDVVLGETKDCSWEGDHCGVGRRY